MNERENDNEEKSSFALIVSRSTRVWRRSHPQAMGSFLDKPVTEKASHEGSGNGLLYAASSMQGWRVEMEVSSLLLQAAS